MWYHCLHLLHLIILSWKLCGILQVQCVLMANVFLIPILFSLLVLTGSGEKFSPVNTCVNMIINYHYNDNVYTCVDNVYTCVSVVSFPSV